MAREIDTYAENGKKYHPKVLSRKFCFHHNYIQDYCHHVNSLPKSQSNQVASFVSILQNCIHEMELSSSRSNCFRFVFIIIKNNKGLIFDLISFLLPRSLYSINPPKNVYTFPLHINRAVVTPRFHSVQNRNVDFI